MLRRLGRFVLYQLKPRDSAGVTPASITFWSARGVDAAADASGTDAWNADAAVDWEALATGGLADRRYAKEVQRLVAELRSAEADVLEILALPLPAGPSRQIPAEVGGGGAGHSVEEFAEGGGAAYGTALERRTVPGMELVALSNGRGERRPWVRRLPAARSAAVGITAAVAGTGIVATTTFGGSEGPSDHEASRASQNKLFVPQLGPSHVAPFPSDPRSASGYQTAHVARPTILRESPGGRPRVSITARTEWGSPRVLSVVRQEGEWLGVLIPELKNDELGWLRASEARIQNVAYSLHADLSRRELAVRRDGRTVRRMRMAIGGQRTPTPTGRFAVTDALQVRDSRSPYGCCVLALTGHQTKLPTDWTGGDRLAVHSTRNVDRLGDAITLGCMRTASREARWLIRTIPPGAPFLIRR